MPPPRSASASSGWETVDYYRSLLSSLPQPACLMWPDGAIELANGAYRRFTDGLDDTEQQERWQRALGEARAEVGEEVTRASFELQLDLEGGALWLEAVWIGVARAGPLLLLVRDMSEEREQRRRLEDSHEDLAITVRLRDSELEEIEGRLRVSERLESLGQLAASVTHDFNNMLSVIVGYSELALTRLAPPDPLLSYLQRIQQAGKQAGELTRALLAFGRRQVLEPKVLDLNEVLGEMRGLLEGALREDIALEIRPGSPLDLVHIDRSQFQQAILNLAINARDAMPRGGRLRIETCNVDLSDPVFSARHPDVPPGRYVRVLVSDTGVGMDAATCARVFEPFFTTKSEGHGTGLGLSSVHGFVKQSGGAVVVTSEPGRGTTFRLELPRHDASGRRERPSGGRRNPLARGAGTILLVEDDDLVRELLGEVLRERGYRILEARGGYEALTLAEDTPELDLVIMDVVLPGLSGGELATRIAAHCEGIKILFTSGYGKEELERRGIDTGQGFLSKPPRPQELLQRVQELLDAP